MRVAVVACSESLARLIQRAPARSSHTRPPASAIGCISKTTGGVRETVVDRLGFPVGHKFARSGERPDGECSSAVESTFGPPKAR